MYKAELVAASSYGKYKIFTLDIMFPRAALAEFLTHRVMSKNTASTRAIPIKSHVAFVRENPYIPEWTKNQSGMQGGEMTDISKIDAATDNLKIALNFICDFVEFIGGDEKYGNCGIHKQDAGRYLEPFSYITLRVSFTQYKNFFWLRDDPAAYPPMAKIAAMMKEVVESAEPMELKAGEYHVPGVTRIRCAETGNLHYHDPEGVELSLQEAIELSMSLCAQQSFRKADASSGKTESVIDKLFNGNKVHASPSEHQATPIPRPEINKVGFHRKDGKYVAYVDTSAWPAGVTHMDRNCELWSANFKGWIQHRQLLPNHDAELM